MQAQDITDFLNKGDVDAINQAEAKKVGDLQVQIDYLRAEIEQLKNYHVKVKSDELLRFEQNKDISNDKIYSMFLKKELIAICEELQISTSGNKKELINRIKESL